MFDDFVCGWLTAHGYVVEPYYRGHVVAYRLYPEGAVTARITSEGVVLTIEYSREGHLSCFTEQSGLRFPGGSSDLLGFREVRDLMSELIRQLRDQVRQDGPAKTAHDEEFQTLYPFIWDMLTVDAIDKVPRATSTLFFFVEEGVAKLCINDRDLGRMCFVSGYSFRACLEAIEQGLVSGTLDWRADRRAKKKG